MSIGLGKKYWVHVVKHCSGNSLEECLSFMAENKVVDGSKWFELRPIPILKNGVVVACKEYSCDLVEDASVCKK